MATKVHQFPAGVGYLIFVWFFLLDLRVSKFWDYPHWGLCFFLAIRATQQSGRPSWSIGDLTCVSVGKDQLFRREKQEAICVDPSAASACHSQCRSYDDSAYVTEFAKRWSLDHYSKVWAIVGPGVKKLLQTTIEPSRPGSVPTLPDMWFLICLHFLTLIVPFHVVCCTLGSSHSFSEPISLLSLPFRWQLDAT